jgi:hypothetical protein
MQHCRLIRHSRLANINFRNPHQSPIFIKLSYSRKLIGTSTQYLRLMRGYSTLWTVIVDCIVLHCMHIWHLTIWASSLQFRASKVNMALARMDKLVKKLMSNPDGFCRSPLIFYFSNLVSVLYSKIYPYFAGHDKSW